MENSDWEEVGPEELGKDGAGEQEEAEKSKQTITPKVLDLMVKISEYGYLTMHEIQFIYGNKTWAYKVIKGLRSQGFIADHDTLMYPKIAHYLTPKGYRILGKFGRLKVGIRFKPERYSIFIFRHRMASAKVGLLLEKHPLVREFLTESRLFKKQRDKLYKLCDGEFWYRVPGHEKSDRVGLEVELTLKSNQRLDETFHELSRRGDLDQIWWICANDNIMRAMRREVIVRYTPESHRHFFALLDEFLATKGKAELMDAQGTVFSIDPDKPTLLPSKIELPPQLTVQLQKPEPSQMARAEVPKQPEPAPANPIPDASIQSEGFVKNNRLEKERREERLRRWTLVAAGIFGIPIIAGLIALFSFKYVEIISQAPADNTPTWRVRHVKENMFESDGWIVTPLSLRSKADLYRFKVQLISIENLGSHICGMVIYDSKHRELKHWTWPNAWIPNQSGFDDQYEFRAPSVLKSLELVPSYMWNVCRNGRPGDGWLFHFE